MQDCHILQWTKRSVLRKDDEYETFNDFQLYWELNICYDFLLAAKKTPAEQIPRPATPPLKQQLSSSDESDDLHQQQLPGKILIQKVNYTRVYCFFFLISGQIHDVLLDTESLLESLREENVPSFERYILMNQTERMFFECKFH